MTEPINHDSRTPVRVAQNEKPLSLELRLPSLQHGRGAGAEAEGEHHRPVGCLPCRIHPPSLAFTAISILRATPPHPQPLSRVGERGGEDSSLPGMKWRQTNLSMWLRKPGARILVASLWMVFFAPSPGVLAQVKKTEKPTEQPASTKPQPAAERQSQVQRVFAIKHADVDAIARTLGVFQVPVHPNRELRVVGVSAPAALLPTIEDTIRRLDVPPPTPQNVELTVYLLLGSDQEGSVAPELDGVTKQLKATFGFKGFRMIDTLVVRSRDKQGANVKGVAALGSAPANSSAYQFAYNAARILPDEKGRSIRLDGLRFSANIVTRWDGAGVPVASSDAAFGTDVDVREGQKVVVGKAAVGGTNSALILVITARVLE